MLCRKHWEKTIRILMLLLGAASLLFGLVSYLTVQPEGHAANRLLGMFTGFGAGILGVALYKTVRERLISAEKKEQEAIDQQDERNIAIGQRAAMTGFYTAFGMLAAFTFLFMALDQSIAAYCCLGGLYLTAATVLIARKVLEKRM